MVKFLLTPHRESKTPKDLVPVNFLSSSLLPHEDIHSVFQPYNFYVIHTCISQDSGRRQMIYTKEVTEEFTRLFTKVGTVLRETRMEGHYHL